jgi:hypothetical protein
MAVGDDALLRRFAKRVGLPVDATTNTDLERALATRLGIDQRTEEWAARWLGEFVRRREPEPARVVQQEPTPKRGVLLSQRPSKGRPSPPRG